MKQVWQKLFLMTFPLATLVRLAPLTSVKAQIVPDNSLGAESSVVNRNTIIRGVTSDRIDGGARRGGNLFHSFQEFNVGAQRGAYFSNPTGVENILTRVTGSNPSNISGRLGVLGNANLFLINPNGIVFGRNASLDVRGSFFASTASSLIFNNGLEFSATNPQASLLTVNIPIGLRFRDNPGDITVNGIGQNDGLGGASNSFQNPTLAVDAGKTLALVGGNVTLNGGVLQAPGGQVELGGLTAPGTVGINSNNSLSFPDAVARGDVTLTNQAGINVITNALSGGSININARNVGISGPSLLTAGIARDLGEVNYQAGNITLNSTGETTIDQSRIENNVNVGTTANSGNISIKAGSLSLTNNTQLDASTNGNGNAGNINVQANGTVSLTGGTNTGITSDVGTNAIGHGGIISINAGSVAINDGGQVSASTSGIGNAGSVTITARDLVSFIGTDRNGNPSAAFSTVEAGAVGNGGSININAGSLSLTNGGELNTFIRNATVTLPGRQSIGGDVNINVWDAFTISGTGANNTRSGVFSSLGSGALGRGGSINIQAGSFSLANDAILNASTSGQGNAGNINVQTNGTVSLTGGNDTGIFSNVGTNAVGNGGTISINAGSVTIADGGEVNTLTRGHGDAGSVTITARDAVSFSGTSSNGNFSGATSNVEAGAVGNGGIVTINAESLSLTNGGQLAAIVRDADTNNNLAGGQGNGGDVNINVRDALTISGTGANDTNSGVFTSLGSGALGSGGSINIQAGSFSLANDAILNASTSGQGNAGNINVQTNGTVSLTGGNDTGIFSNVGTNAVGNGGTISINAGSVNINDGGEVNTLTRGHGDAGSVTITARDVVSFSGTSSIDRFPSSASSNVEAGAVGNGGIVTINAGSLSLTNGGQLAAIVRQAQNNLPGGQGIGGDVNINVRDALTISGTGANDTNSGVFTSLGSGALGRGGSINIQAGSFSLANDARLDASTSGKGNAGNIYIATGELLLRSNSRISTSASTTGNGGNITINAPLIVAFPSNNDITANASGGIGGKVTINTQGLFGIAPLSRTELERRLNMTDPLDPSRLTTSDITAISQQSPSLNGTVNINTSYLNPSQGLVKLPENVVDPTTQIAQNPCQHGAGSSLAITGRGGIPSNPNQTLASDNVRVGLVTPVSNRVTAKVSAILPSKKPTVKKAVPVQGWIFNDKGQVVLTAYDPTKTGSQRPWRTPASCAKR